MIEFPTVIPKFLSREKLYKAFFIGSKQQKIATDLTNIKIKARTLVKTLFFQFQSIFQCIIRNSYLPLLGGRKMKRKDNKKYSIF